MKCHRPFTRTLTAPVLLIAAMLTVGCSEEPASHDRHDHAAHDHAEHDHAGHDHAAHGDAEQSAAAILAAHKHDDPNETCFMCDPAKRDKGRLWCKEHVRYEDRCWLCHPEIEDPDRLYCKEHFLYEDECFLCHPELEDDDSKHKGHDHDEHGHDNHEGHDHGDGQAHGMRDGRLFCNEHGVFEDECGICQPDLAQSMQPGQNLKVRMPSAQSADKAGVRVGKPSVGTSTAAIEALCEVQYNRNALARVTPLADGVIREVQRDVGDRVEAGDVLVELHSSKVAESKSEYLSALVERDTAQQALSRQQRLREQNIAAEKDLINAQAEQRAASLRANNLAERLVNLGFTTEEIEAIQSDQDTSARLVVRAPFAGTVVERDAVVGEAVDTGVSLFTVADLSTRWLVLSVPARHLTQIEKGQAVVATFDELPGVEIKGQITWIDTAIDPRSRLIKARAEVIENADKIKTGLFGKARVVVGDQQPATLVPRDSVQQHAGNSYVFVQDEADLFSLRRVSLGQSDRQTIEVLAGLASNDPVVTQGSFVVMSEFLKSRLGAGCADH